MYSGGDRGWGGGGAWAGSWATRHGRSFLSVSDFNAWAGGLQGGPARAAGVLAPAELGWPLWGDKAACLRLCLGEEGRGSGAGRRLGYVVLEWEVAFL